jgi:hypothetical protein
MKNIFSLLIALSLLAGCVLNAPAQTRIKSKNISVSSSNKRLKKSQPVLTPSPTPALTPTPITVQNDVISNAVSVPQSTSQEISGDLQSGNVIVNVSSNGNAVVKIGLAERGVTVIDFPANDPVYKIHPGDENFVTVDCSARAENGKCGNSPTDAIILRPGKNFHSLDSEESSATVVTIQRVSGIVVSFIVVPVKTIAQNANYVVVRYDLREVVEARMKAGLSVNLQPGVVSLPNVVKPNTEENKNDSAQFLNTTTQTEKTSTTPANIDADTLQEAVVAELQRVGQNSSGLRFSKPVYGISLARASSGSRTGDIIIDVIAVRNTLPQPVRLLSEPNLPFVPELVVENRDKRDASVNVQRINIISVATTVDGDDVLMPGQIHYFAIAYSSPILGVKQVLRVNFAQREAADAPASIELGGLAR